MIITEIAFVGYSVTDTKRTKAFYEGVLGLKKSRGFGLYNGNDQWAEYDIGAGCLVLISGGEKDWPPGSTGTAAAFEVDDFPGYVSKMRAAGTPFVFPPNETPICSMVVVTDPDANRVVIHKRKPR
jgi:predicted enzyme related to lactoylglutathione lyase